MSTNRSRFLGRVASAVRSGKLHLDPVRREIAPSVGYLGAGADPVGRLEQELRAVGAQAQRLHSREDVAVSVRLLVERHSIRRAVRNAAPLFEELGIDDVLRRAGVELLTPTELAALDEPTRRDRLFAADLGLAAPDWAIAETGSLVYLCGPEQIRSVTLLPPVHVAIVDARRVLPDLFDLFNRLPERSTDGAPPGSVVLVTGPSKTGDIELRLTTGVHGPGEVHVLVWEPK
jgi:L-lactate utilization protein LutC